MGTYRPDPVRTFEVPKPGGGMRRMARLSRRDAAAWDALAGRVAGAVEARLDRRVLAARAIGGRTAWRLSPLRPALRRARRAARILAAGGPMVATDVRACYPSIRPPVLHEALLRAEARPDDARLARDMLEGWGSHGLDGLPIGPRGSAVLANAVLLSVDAGLGRTPFLRWVDDYLLGDPRAVPRLDEALDYVGLHRSERKTRFGAALPWPGTAAAYSGTASWAPP